MKKTFDPDKIARSLINLMFYTNEDEPSKISYEKAKQQALISIAFAIENAETDDLLEKFKEVQKCIQEINL